MRPSWANQGAQDVFLWSQLLRKRARLRRCPSNLEIFEEDTSWILLKGKIALLKQLLAGLRKLPNVAETRQCGMIAGIEVLEAAENGSLGRSKPALGCASRRANTVC